MGKPHPHLNLMERCYGWRVVVLSIFMYLLGKVHEGWNSGRLAELNANFKTWVVTCSGYTNTFLKTKANPKYMSLYAVTFYEFRLQRIRESLDCKELSNTILNNRFPQAHCKMEHIGHIYTCTSLRSWY